MIDVDYNERQTINAAVSINSAPPLDRLGFVIAADLVEEDEENEHINLITGFSTTKDCKGTFNYTMCTLKSAVGE